MKEILSAIGVVVIGAVGAYWLFGGTGVTPQNAAGGAALPVPAMKVSSAHISLTHDLPGRLAASKTGEIRPQVDGIILQRLFEEGADVAKGQQLYQIDPKPYQAAYASSVAELKKAEAVVKSTQARADRYMQLLEVDAISQQEYDDIVASLAEAKASVAVAQASVNIAQVNLDYTKVYAPIDGVIGKSYVTEGALVTANQSSPLARVTQLEPIYADLTMPSQDLLKLRQQLSSGEADVLLQTEDGTTSYPQKGTLKFAEVQVDETTGSVLLRALFPNAEHHLLPGMFVRASILLPSEDRILIPQEAAQRQKDGQLVVLKVDANGVVSAQGIQVLSGYKNQWVVTDGLQSGDVILVSGFQKVKAGATVKPVFADESVSSTAQ